MLKAEMNFIMIFLVETIDIKRDATLSAIPAPTMPIINNTAKRNIASLGKSASITNASFSAFYYFNDFALNKGSNNNIRQQHDHK
jgi:hypothetical protein